ncbi:hypothetical protein [Romboutsia maritimum]|uniref:hypothetical protein n=1 Tax=Romboutsia maritimum TaxID=2020948 RepID=UPI00131463EF|nr:hypothetical protein [Romboutsia maritimum]
MGSKRKFKRDYIILEAKDMNFRYKERVLPKAFAKVEINDEKSVVALYVENLKYMRDGYRVMAIQSDYETLDLGKITVNQQGKGEFVLDLKNDECDIKAIAMLYEKSVPLIGFKGNKIENYEEILFMGEEEYIEEDNDREYEEIEYIEIEEDDDIDGEFDEYDEMEYIEVEEDEIDDVNNEEDDEDEEDDDDENNQYYEFDEEDENEEDDEENDDEEDDEHQNQENEEYRVPQYNKTNKLRNTQNQKKQSKKNKTNQNKTHNQKPRQYKQQSTNSTLLMPRQIKKGLKYFKEVKPFVSDYIEDTRWWKIEINPATLCGYTMPYLGYVNSLNYTMYSDAVMQSYKYRHYLFGVQYDEYNKRKNYIYAVPGGKSEQPDKGHTGFMIYQACDNRNNSLGYWLCFIDSRSRRIAK